MFGDLIGKGRSGPQSAAKADAKAGAEAFAREGTDASFMVDVVEASRHHPVIVDFWAPWCGPCRQLTPAIERAVAAAKGAVRLVKINVDENPAYAGQLRVQSIPAVFAFRNGQPVDGFMGALPESQISAFIARLIAEHGGGPAEQVAEDLEAVLAEAREAQALGDHGGAAQAYAHILSVEPTHAKAIAGLARLYLAMGDTARAGEILAMAAPDDKDADLAAARTALSLAAKATAETADLEARLTANPDDHQARHDLAQVLAGRGRYDAAIDHLLTIVAKDRSWNEDGARKSLLTVFEAAGPTSEAVKAGRKRLSSLLFS